MESCPICGGPGVLLGTLVTTWLRCRDCGSTFIWTPPDEDFVWDDDTTEAVARAIGLTS